MDKPIALITGSARKGGLGFETARQLGCAGYQVILAGRHPDVLPQLVDELTGQDISASWVALDITDEESALEAAAAVKRAHGRVDVLINNAASMRAGDTVERQDIAEVRQVFDTNVIGTWNVTQAFLPLVRASEHGRIVNVSSGAGSLRDPRYGLLDGSMGIPCSGYGISKLALNGFTIKLAKEVADEGILVNAVCPDITDTFGSNGAWGRPVETSAKSVTWAAMLPDDGPTGGFFRDGEPLPW